MLSASAACCGSRDEGLPGILTRSTCSSAGVAAAVRAVAGVDPESAAGCGSASSLLLQAIATSMTTAVTSHSHHDFPADASVIIPSPASSPTTAPAEPADRRSPLLNFKCRQVGAVCCGAGRSGFPVTRCQAPTRCRDGACLSSGDPAWHRRRVRWVGVRWGATLDARASRGRAAPVASARRRRGSTVAPRASVRPRRPRRSVRATRGERARQRRHRDERAAPDRARNTRDG